MGKVGRNVIAACFANVSSKKIPQSASFLPFLQSLTVLFAKFFINRQFGICLLLAFSTDNRIKDDDMTVIKHLTKRLKVSVGVLAVSSALIGSAFAKNDINIDYEKVHYR